MAAKAQTKGTQGEQNTATQGTRGHAKFNGKPGRDATRDGQGRARQGNQRRHGPHREAPRAEQPNDAATQVRRAKPAQARRAARRERQRAANADRDAGRAKQHAAGTIRRNRHQGRQSKPTGQQATAPQAVQAVQAALSQAAPQFSITPEPSGEPGSFTFTIRVLNGQHAPTPFTTGPKTPTASHPSQQQAAPAGKDNKENDARAGKKRRRPRCGGCNKYGHRKATCPNISPAEHQPAPALDPTVEVSVVAAPAEPTPGETLAAGQAVDAETAAEQALLDEPDDVPMDTGDLEEEGTILEGMDTLIINPTPSDRALE